jgi:hypothetical protein
VSGRAEAVEPEARRLDEVVAGRAARLLGPLGPALLGQRLGLGADLGRRSLFDDPV